MKKTGTKLQNYLEKELPSKIIKNDRQTIDISKFPHRMKEQLLKVSAP